MWSKKFAVTRPLFWHNRNALLPVVPFAIYLLCLAYIYIPRRQRSNHFGQPTCQWQRAASPFRWVGGTKMRDHRPSLPIQCVWVARSQISAILKVDAGAVQHHQKSWFLEVRNHRCPLVRQVYRSLVQRCSIRYRHSLLVFGLVLSDQGLTRF